MPQFNIKQVKGSTQGSVLFLGTNGIVSENNDQFYWNNSALLIGTTSQFGTEKLRVNGSQRIDGDLMVVGSFSVLGSASVINTQNLYVQDPIILLASTQSGSPVLDSGLFINRGTGATQAFIWDESADEFIFIQTNDASTVIGNVNISSYANIRANGATLSQVKITSGASNGYILISDSVGLGSWTSSIPNGTTGSGVVNYVPRWLSSTNLSATGSIYDDGANVGIGTLSPSTKLHVTAPNSGAIDIVAVRPSVFGGGIYLSSTSTNNPIIYLQSTSSLTTIALRADGDTIFNGGNVGIGSSPATKLHVVGSAGTDVISMRPSLYNGGIYQSVAASSNPFLYMQSTASATTVRIDSNGDSYLNSGNFGIGTLSPTTKLHIVATYSGGGFRLVDTTQASGYVLMSDSTGVGTWTSSSNISINANNGLTYSGGVVKLGGPLIQNTVISNTSNIFTMSSNSDIFFEIVDSFGSGPLSRTKVSEPSGTFSSLTTNISSIIMQSSDITNTTGVAATPAYVNIDSGLNNITLYSSNQNGADGSTNNRMIIDDSSNSKGLIYAGSYSANFTTYSLVTKEYVDSVAGTSSGVTGSGIANYIPRWLSSTNLSSTSSIIDSGNEIGIGTQSNATYKVSIQGDVNILGTLYATSKSFEIQHPLDPSRRLTYGSLEGPEYGVYYRGKLERNTIIDLPNYWTGLVDESSITVNITPIGFHQRIFVEKIEGNKVYLGVDNSGPPNCYYVVYAERKDIPKITVE